MAYYNPIEPTIFSSPLKPLKLGVRGIAGLSLLRPSPGGSNRWCLGTMEWEGTICLLEWSNGHIIPPHDSPIPFGTGSFLKQDL